jgi:hypothetical protein
VRVGGQRRAHAARAGHGRRREMAPAGIVVPEAARAKPHAVQAIERAAHEDAQPGAGAPARLLVNLQPDALEGDGVVLPHGTPGRSCSGRIE